ncbi:PseG/SpsG family protein [Nocardioides limicola]|uniref:PseG/SpsG family protein n=1 Tax=Nocardioides limicola TaxID=2803368 RepID=UPI00193C341B|nr:spore coat protein [Nocardioides sp. DJM-14]
MAVDALICCDLGPRVGVGHLMRCLALAEELLARGRGVVVAADVESVPFAAEQLRARGIRSVPAAVDAADHLELLKGLQPRVVVIDSYALPAAVYSAVRERVDLVAIVDGDPRDRDADIYVDQNFGSEDETWVLAPGSRRMAGSKFALMRDDIIAQRPATPRRGGDRDPPEVFAFFGGTDAYGAAPVVARALARTRAPFSATFVARPDQHDDVARVPIGTGQSLSVIEPTDDLAARMARADLVISAAGTSIWELACVGVAAGLVCVADNQRDGYDRVVGEQVAVGIGRLAELRERRTAEPALARLMIDGGLRDRLRERAWALVDGRGRQRVVDVMGL